MTAGSSPHFLTFPPSIQYPTIYDLKEAAFISCPEGVVIRKQETKPQSKSSSVYQRLVAAGQRLLTVIRHNEGGANKDLAKLTSQINNLCDTWDR